MTLETMDQRLLRLATNRMMNGEPVEICRHDAMGGPSEVLATFRYARRDQEFAQERRADTGEIDGIVAREHGVYLRMPVTEGGSGRLLRHTWGHVGVMEDLEQILEPYFNAMSDIDKHLLSVGWAFEATMARNRREARSMPDDADGAGSASSSELSPRP